MMCNSSVWSNHVCMFTRVLDPECSEYDYVSIFNVNIFMAVYVERN